MIQLLLLATPLLFFGAKASVDGPEPIVSLWYRGQPEGTPRIQDLDAIRATGFSAVTWPGSGGAESMAITRLAAEAGLKVVFRPQPIPFRPETTDAIAGFVDIRATQLPAEAIWPAVWRAVAHGARVISFDPGQAAPADLADVGRSQPKWVSVAAAVGRQFGANGGLFGRCRPGPGVLLDRPAPRSLDVVLLDADKSWVLIATNASGARVHGVAHLPAHAPYAMWLNLLDGSTMAMLEERQGPRWVFDLEAWGVRMYVIDKILK